MSRIFQKPPLTTTQLINQLKNKGLIIPSEDVLQLSLKTIGYYRLSAYFLAFKNQYQETKPFKKGVSFDDVLSLYTFDKKLRLLILDPIETLEISLRSSLTDVMSLKYGAHWYLKSDLFIEHVNLEKFLNDIKSICRKRKEVFLKHYYKSYDMPKYPPSWMILECLSFGACTQLLMNIKTLQDKKDICQIFGYHPTIIESWFSVISSLRNLCAHHARIWNRWFAFAPISPHEALIPAQKHTFCEQAHIISRLLKCISEEKAVDWQEQLFDLLGGFPKVSKQKMGFISNWQKDLLWYKNYEKT